MRFGECDLGVFFSDGVPVEFGAQSTKGNLDEPGAMAELLGLPVQDREHTLEIARGSLEPMPKRDEVLKVDGRYFRVRKADPVDDGGVIRITLGVGAKL